MLPNKRILIVDDDELTCSILSRFLLSAGCTKVESINDSREAVSAAIQSRPDMILLDLMMPDPDGLAVLKQLGEKDVLDSTVVVMLTAVSESEMKDHALKLGAVDFITKPIGPEALMKRISQIFEIQSGNKKKASG